MPCLRINGRDHPIWCDLAGDPPPAVSPISSLGRFHVLTRNQSQQRHHFGLRIREFGAFEMSEHR